MTLTTTTQSLPLHPSPSYVTTNFRRAISTLRCFQWDQQKRHDWTLGSDDVLTLTWLSFLYEYRFYITHSVITSQQGQNLLMVNTSTRLYSYQIFTITSHQIKTWCWGSQAKISSLSRTGQTRNFLSSHRTCQTYGYFLILHRGGEGLSWYFYRLESSDVTSLTLVLLNWRSWADITQRVMAPTWTQSKQTSSLFHYLISPYVPSCH